MANVKTRVIIASIVLLGFSVPFIAIVTLEKIQSKNKAMHDQEAILESKKKAEDARAAYYLEVDNRKEDFKKGMEDAQSQYNKLLEEQPKIIQENTQTVQKTVVSPPQSSATTKSS